MYPKISIILPIYNVAKYLSTSIESAINQTYGNIEIICVNDGSTDNSETIIKKYLEQDPRIKLVNQENKGLSICTGDYVLFLDSDDWLDSDAIKNCLPFIESFAPDIIMYDINNVYQDSIIPVRRVKSFLNKYHTNLLHYNDNKLIIYQNGSAWAKLYKSKFLSQNRLYFNENVRFSEDSIFWIQLLLCNPLIALLDKHCYFYRKQRNGSLSNNSEDLLDRLWDVCNNFLNLDLIKEQKEEDKLYALDYHTRIAIYCYSSCHNFKILKHYEKTLKKFSEEYKKFNNNLLLFKLTGYRLLKFRWFYTIVKLVILKRLKLKGKIK